MSDYQDLPAMAYQARQQPRDNREKFARRLANTIVVKDGVSSQATVFGAEALHIVSTTLAGELPPRDLIELLRAPIMELRDRRRDAPELGYYCGLLVRTVSMAASKLDNYTGAFHHTNQAHRAYRLTHGSSKTRRAVRDEAQQQVYLQECGQLIRNVEAGLVESDPAARARQLDGEPPDTCLDAELELAPMLIIARAGAEAGRRACSILDRIKLERALDTKPDPERRTLAVRSWVLTADIMYMRALLLASLIELCVPQRDRNDPPPYLDEVARMYSRITEVSLLETDHPTLTIPHQMDLTRNVLLWSFLTNTRHPYVKSRDSLVRVRDKLPKYFVEADRGRLDTAACSAALAARNHNAGILDNLGRSEPYRRLIDLSGPRAASYGSWLAERHKYRRSRIESDPDLEVLDVRAANATTRARLRHAARMVIRSGRYSSVRHGHS
ncbi:hypothetical protein [Mycolicibacterium cosmeticum]|uniref:hypothetical protein n=1 Tax=Mycolicibacterium cosmeticum TaxID=258533 RepID=UPI003204DF1B